MYVDEQRNGDGEQDNNHGGNDETTKEIKS